MGVDGIVPLTALVLMLILKNGTLINDPEVLLLDTRNEYEVEIGTFQMQSILGPVLLENSEYVEKI